MWIGLLCIASTWLVYCGYIPQWRKVWKNNTRPTIPYVLVLVAYLTAINYILWGVARTPTDWSRIAAFIPGLVAAPILALQFRSPRPNKAALCVRVVVILLSTLLLACIGWRCEAWLKNHLDLQAGLATACSIANIAIVMPSQIVKLLREGSKGSSVILNAINLGSFVVWLSYAIQLGDPWLFASQATGVGLQACVVLLHFR
jgi:hypothetical protein